MLYGCRKNRSFDRSLGVVSFIIGGMRREDCILVQSRPLDCSHRIAVFAHCPVAATGMTRPGCSDRRLPWVGGVVVLTTSGY